MRKALNALAGAGKTLNSTRSEIIELVGLAAVAAGIGMICVPAGIIAAGVALCFLGYATDRGA